MGSYNSHKKDCMMLSIAEHPHCTCGFEKRKPKMGVEINLDPDKRLIPLSAVPSLLAELTGVTRTRNTIYNWAKKGCRTLDGRLVKLKTTMRMNQTFTTKKDVLEFIQKVG